jgi:outer membrane protein assembly factor BamB
MTKTGDHMRCRSRLFCRFAESAGTSWLPALALAVLGWSAVTVRADDWPQWLGPKRDGIWRETGILEQFPASGPKVRWRTPIGAGYAGPAVADGRVYVTDRQLAAGVKNPVNAFGRSPVPGTERVLCLEEATGKIIWQSEYDCRYQVSYPAGPRTTPVVHDGRVYTLGTMGDLLCLDTQTGKVLWSKNFPKEYEAKTPLWGFSSHPLLDGNKLICLTGGPESMVAAFDAQTGRELWHALATEDPTHGPGYCPPMIFEIGGKRQLIIWHPNAVSSLDPETGAVYWSQPFRLQSGLAIPTPRLAGDLLLVSSFYNGSMMLKLDTTMPRAQLLWKGKSNSEAANRTDGLHSIMCTPFVKDGYIYGVCSYGQLRCLNAKTGERVWQTLRATGTAQKPVERWANAFLVAQADRFFLFNEKGDLIIARLTPQGYDELSRAHILEPTNRMPGRPVIWSHPAFANKSMYVRNDKEIVCVSLAAETTSNAK